MLAFDRSDGDPKKALGLTLADPKVRGGKGEWLVTRPGADPEPVAPAKLAERLKALRGKDQAVALEVGKSWPWSSAVQALAACQEAEVKELVLGR